MCIMKWLVIVVYIVIRQKRINDQRQCLSYKPSSLEIVKCKSFIHQTVSPLKG